MNLSVEQFLSGLRTSLRELPGLLKTWHDLDDDLQNAYAHQLQWMLNHFEDIQARSGANGLAVAVELVAARQLLFAMRDDICEATGVVVDLAPRLSVASSHGLASAPEAPPSSPPPRVEAGLPEATSVAA